MKFNIELSASNQQKGLWLEVWIGNSRAISFYKEFGFNIIDEGSFMLTKTHANPHYVMYLKY